MGGPRVLRSAKVDTKSQDDRMGFSSSGGTAKSVQGLQVPHSTRVRPKSRVARAKGTQKGGSTYAGRAGNATRSFKSSSWTTMFPFPAGRPLAVPAFCRFTQHTVTAISQWYVLNSLPCAWLQFQCASSTVLGRAPSRTQRAVSPSIPAPAEQRLWAWHG